MVLSDEELKLIDILLKLRKAKLTQADKAAIVEYVGNDLNRYTNIVYKISETFAGTEDAAKSIIDKYTSVGLDSFLETKFVKSYIQYANENFRKTPEENLAALKDIFNTNKSCPVAEIKNGIILAILRYLVLYNGVAKDSAFVEEVYALVKKMSDSEIQKAVTLI